MRNFWQLILFWTHALGAVLAAEMIILGKHSPEMFQLPIAFALIAIAVKP